MHILTNQRKRAAWYRIYIAPNLLRVAAIVLGLGVIYLVAQL